MVWVARAKTTSVGRATPDTDVPIRALRDGAIIVAPWYQALVFEGRVFGAQAGSVTTPIAGHAAIDADQPELAVFVAAAGTTLIPVYVEMTMETGSTTLAQGGMMAAVSNINVGVGTSTEFTPFNLKFSAPGYNTAAAAAHTYTGNGTDPLTAGNFLELARVSAVIDADAAVAGIVPPVLRWSVVTEAVAPCVEDIGSILAYGEAAANTLFARILWAELATADL